MGLLLDHTHHNSYHNVLTHTERISIGTLRISNCAILFFQTNCKKPWVFSSLKKKKKKKKKKRRRRRRSKVYFLTLTFTFTLWWRRTSCCLHSKRYVCVFHVRFLPLSPAMTHVIWMFLSRIGLTQLTVGVRAGWKWEVLEGSRCFRSSVCFSENTWKRGHKQGWLQLKSKYRWAASGKNDVYSTSK